MSDKAVARARSLVGVRFRAQGRRVDAGLDCVGVILQAFGLAEGIARSDYRLRGDHREEAREQLARAFEEVPPATYRRGDVLLFEVARDQVHLAVCCGDSVVHADAAIGRVVETPGLPWPIISAHRPRNVNGFDPWQP